jgi:hypothetical protein
MFPDGRAAAARLAELEQQVTDACDQEDFERADELTKEIEYVEREAAAATAAARAAEGESDSASAKVGFDTRLTQTGLGLLARS